MRKADEEEDVEESEGEGGYEAFRGDLSDGGGGECKNHKAIDGGGGRGEDKAGLQP